MIVVDEECWELAYPPIHFVLFCILCLFHQRRKSRAVGGCSACPARLTVASKAQRDLACASAHTLLSLTGCVSDPGVSFWSSNMPTSCFLCPQIFFWLPPGMEASAQMLSPQRAVPSSVYHVVCFIFIRALVLSEIYFFKFYLFQ